VALSLGGEDTYKTLYGSIASILLAAYMAYVLYVQAAHVFKREIDSSTTKLAFSNYEKFDPFAHGFSFAIGFDKIDYLDPTFIEIQAAYVSITP